MTIKGAKSRVITNKDAIEWFASLSADKKVSIKKLYEEYCNSVSVIYRMSLNEWIINNYSKDIRGFLDNYTFEVPQAKHIDVDMSKKDVEQEVKKEEDKEEETRDEDVKYDDEEAKKKAKALKIAIMLLTAGLVGILL